MENNINTASPKNKLSPDVLAKVKIPRKFEIFVEEYTEADIGCQAGWRPVQVDSRLGGNGGNPILTVTCQADLQEKINFYKQLGQRFKILREIDPPTPEAIYKAASEQGLVKNETASDPESENKNTDDSAEEKQTARIAQCERQNDSQLENAKTDSPFSTTAQIKTAAVKTKPKIITIGDVQIKYDGDKVYQKQWMKLTPAESSNFRIISDSSNKLVSMNGKHIEAKRWVLVENTVEDGDVAEDLVNA